MNLRLARPALLVDLKEVAGLETVREEGGALVVGATARQRDVERSPIVAARWPLLAEALGFVAHPAIRVRGTVCGSLAHADPAAELPAVALLLDAELSLRSVDGERRVAATDFFTGHFATVLEPDEILVEARFPVLASTTGTAFVEVARRHGDFALVGAAAAVRRDRDGLAEVRVALTGVGAGPVRFPSVEAEAVGRTASRDTFREVGEAVAAELDPPADMHASAAYRRRVAATVVERSLARALERAA